MAEQPGEGRAVEQPECAICSSRAAIPVAEPWPQQPAFHYCCHRLPCGYGLEILQAMLQTNSKAVRLLDGFGMTVLHRALDYEGEREYPLPPTSVVQKLLQVFPECLVIQDNGDSTGHLLDGQRGTGCTPLHYLLRCIDDLDDHDDDPQLYDLVQLLTEAGPAALGIINSDGDTPFHIACGPTWQYARLPWEESPWRLRSSRLTIIQFLLPKCPQFISVKNVTGFTPLLNACQQNSDSLIESMAEICPTAVQVTSSQHYTALLCCITGHRGIARSTLELLLRTWPVAALMSADEEYGYLEEGTEKSRRMIPIDVLIRREERSLVLNRNIIHVERSPSDSQQLLGFLFRYTKEVTIALLECILSRHSRFREKLRDAVTAIVPFISSEGTVDDDWDLEGLPLVLRARQHLNMDMIRALLDMAEVQEVLRLGALQAMICATVVMNSPAEGRRQHVLQHQSDRAQAVFLLERVSSNQDCQFIHLCENPMLFVCPTVAR